VKFIPRNEIIIVGEAVVTSGLDPNIPRGLMVGNVVAIENESYQPFQQAVVSPLLDLNKLTIVSILQKKLQ
jgi:cell shape-determining protein MreC